MRIALAQVNPIIGDIPGNTRKIIDFIERARAQSAQLVVFPELAIPGYPPKDLLLKPSFIADNIEALLTIAQASRGITTIVGYAERNERPVGRPLHNAVAVLRDGHILSKHLKTLLPTYDVFDESRYFEPGDLSTRNQIVDVEGVHLGISIC
jgi:NAD+ synthase (glutamine-hydrolysing)